jgi:hypothetical protein
MSHCIAHVSYNVMPCRQTPAYRQYADGICYVCMSSKPANICNVRSALCGCVNNTKVWCLSCCLQLKADKTEPSRFGSRTNTDKFAYQALSPSIVTDAVSVADTVRNLGCPSRFATHPEVARCSDFRRLLFHLR